MDLFSSGGLISAIKTLGYFGVFGIIFAESGLLVGFFLPGDSLLFTAGFLASQGVFNIYLLLPLVLIAAVTGDSFGYSFGYRIGPKIFKKKNSLFFSQDNVVRAQKFYEKHGSKTIVLARFFPIIRTFVPILAGVGKMRYRHFLMYNIIGGSIWAIGATLAGFFLGGYITDIDSFLLPLVVLIVLTSLVPAAAHLLIKKKPIMVEVVEDVYENK